MIIVVWRRLINIGSVLRSIFHCGISRESKNDFFVAISNVPTILKKLREVELVRSYFFPKFHSSIFSSN